MTKLRVLDLFSGIGGFSLGLERTGGFETVAFCEIDPYCQVVLRKHWPGVPCDENVECVEFAEGGADVVAAGFPCQDISLAGSVWGDRPGLSGARSGLWRHVVRAVRVVRPLHVLLENVAALLGNGMGTVLGDLAALGYDAEWHCIPAHAVGAPQTRDRVWIAAHPGCERVPGLVTDGSLGAARPWGPRGKADLQSLADAPFERGARWPQPLVCGNDERVPGWAHRVGALGNAVVPQIPEMIGRAILAAETQREAA